MGPPPTRSSPLRIGLSWTTFPWWFLTLYRRPWIFLTLLGIPLVAACAWLYTVHERQWRAQESRHLVVAARLAARTIHEELTRTRQIEDAIASRPSFVAAIKRRDRTALENSLTMLLDVTPMIDHVSIIEPTGKPLAEVGVALMDRSELEPSPEPPWEQPRIPSDDPPDPRPDGAPLVSGVYLRDAASGEKVVGVSAPVRDGPTTVGTLQVQYRLQEISRWLEKIRIEPAGFLYVVDQEGRLVAYPFQLLPGQPKDVSRWAPVAGGTSALGTLVRFAQGPARQPWTAAVVSVEPYGWRVVAQQPDAAMLKPFRQLVGSFVLLVCLLAGLISWLVLRWVHLHTVTLRLLAQQAQLLKLSEQRRLIERFRRAKRERS